MEYDAVEKPSHYNQGKRQAIVLIDEILEQMVLDGKQGYRLGNALKYIIRHQHKGTPEQDIRKAVWYLLRLAEGYGGDKDGK